MTPIRLILAAYFFVLLSSDVRSSQEEEESHLLSLPNELIAHVFKQDGSDKGSETLGLVCRNFQEIHQNFDFPDEEIDQIVRASIAPGSEDAFPMEEARQFFGVADRASRRLFRARQKTKYGSMANFVAAGDHVGSLNDDFLTLMQLLRNRAPNVTNLSFSGFTLKMVPRDIDLLRPYFSIDLSMNDIRELPEEVGQLHTLIHLNLNRNRISRLPRSFDQLNFLGVLKLDHNNLTEFPPELERLPLLRVLSLEGNQIQEIPVTLGGLKNIKLLNLSSNKIVFIPSSIERLHDLENLYLDKNQLLVLPDSLWTLTGLLNLWLANNNLMQIPESISRMTRLTNLIMDDNYLLELPQGLQNLPLQYVSFRGNPYLQENGSYPAWVYEWALMMWNDNRYVGY